VSDRIAKRFAALKAEGRGGLILFVTAGDPDFETSAEIVTGLAAAGADLVELGMPFSDPMADGPAIQAAGARALAAGARMSRTLDLARAFRAKDADTPLILMGYYNPIYVYGCERFAADAAAAGADGLIVVDLPPEEEEELKPAAEAKGLAMIRLVAPTTGDARLDLLLADARGFIYTVAVAGVTGTASAAEIDIEAALARIRARTTLPVAIGFGIKTPAQAAAMAKIGDAAVVGSALVQHISDGLDERNQPRDGLVQNVLGFASELARAVRGEHGG